MTARCPKCSSSDVRLHGTQAHFAFERRWHFFGRWVLRARPVAAECSCGACSYAFIVRPEGVTAAPRQDAYDALEAARAGIEIAEKVTREKVTQPRPAPDPRIRKR